MLNVECRIKKRIYVFFFCLYSIFHILYSPPACGAGWKTPTRKGVDEYKKGDYQSAWNSFNRAGQNDPKNPVIQFNKGCAAYKMQDMETAGQAFEESKVLSIKDLNLRSESLYNYGNVQMGLGQKDKAIEAYKRALLLNPKDSDARHNLAIALRREKPPENKNAGGQGGGQEQQDNSKENQDQKNQKQQPQMGQQELEALLEAFEQDEMNQLKKMKKRKPQEPSAENDW
ncbi:MAG: tetratricopeptide repeat protein [Elusimicrobia bacterium]|nr:tetratricopeptide repeat protein [Elusimicrobiota bacterium]